MKLIRATLVFASFALSVSFIATPLSTAGALSGSDFKPGRIIDDAIFTNKNAMSVTQIQAFLNSKVPTCEINHSAYNAQNPPPYTCLKDYQENTTTGANNFGQFTNGNPNSVAGGKSAAQIIWEASQQYNINPQVMIVLLQKEQGLVTDTWPLLSQFTKATGYLCPDTAACNSNAGGFSKQVFGAAWQFRNDLNGIDTPGFFSVYGKGWNNIRLSPNASCGTKSVNILNQATAVLYKYTPYTPNDAALANLSGIGDGCSAYGNRNFWRYFNDWFGSTLLPEYSAQAMSQSPYPTIVQGQKSVAYFTFKNTGTAVWYDDISAWSLGQNVTKLATDYPLNRNSPFSSDWRWGPTRASDVFAAVYEADGTTLAANQHVAQPGQIVKFAFNLSTSLGTPTGYYVESFRPIVEGYGAMNNTGTWLGVTVAQANYSATPYAQSYYPTIAQGQSAPAFFSYKNNGNVPWYDEVSAWVAGQRPVRLATDSALNRASAFGSGWRFGPARPAENFAAVYEADGTTLAANQHVAQPGQIVKFAFNLSTTLGTPSGFYAEGFRPAVEGFGPMNPTGTWIGVTVQ